jgi:DNA gyrase subunit B
MSINTTKSIPKTMSSPLTNKDSVNYNSSTIKILKGLEAVRKRPGMYIGDTDDGTGLHHMVFEVVDNSIDEALAGYCSQILVTLHSDGSVSVKDNGRGIPVDTHTEEGRSAAEVIMTVLHAGGKFDDNVYKVSGGLHGVGVSVVNALSERLQLQIARDSQLHEQMYSYGEPLFPLLKLRASEEQGTQIRFYPNRKIFKQNNVFDYDRLLTRLRELAFLNPGVAITLKDQRVEDKEAQLAYEGGLTAFVDYLNHEKPCILPNAFYTSGEQQGISVEVALTWQESFSKETVLCFTNTIPQRDGGKHLEGFRSALTRTLNQYLEKEGFTKKFKVEMVGEDFREGLIGVLAIKVPDPKFSSQTKEKLVSSEVRGVVETILAKKLEDFLLENPNDAKAIALKALKAAQAREAAAKARKIARKTSLNNIAGLDKLNDCQEQDPRFSELYLVEGKSAGGTVKQARSRRFQAVLPLRGKILNIERISFDKMLSSEEIATLIAALGCGVGYEYNIEKLRYHRIIIMTDADVDGSHIRTLLLTFFYRQFPELIDQGYLYIAHPPLYKLKKGKQEVYLQDDAALEAWLADHVLEEAGLYAKNSAEPLLTKEALEKLMAKYRDIKMCLRLWEKDYPSLCLQTLLELPPLTIAQLSDKACMKQFCKSWQEKVARYATNTDTYYRITYFISEESLASEKPLYLPKISEWRYSIESDYFMTSAFFQSKEYQKMTQLAKRLASIVLEESVIKQSGREQTISSFYELYNWLMQEASRGYTIQRYKGLGEMDWEELLPVVDPETRQLSRVTTADAQAADKMVTVLMGSVVEDRRKFIEQNALEVEDIDV